MITTSPTASYNLKAQMNLGYIWLISSVAALGDLLFGWDWVVIGGAKPFFQRYFQLNLGAILLMLSLVPPASAAPQKASPAALQAWRDARFGMFIHWGPVCLTEKEISWSRANSNPECPNHGPTPVEVYDNLYK